MGFVRAGRAGLAGNDRCNVLFAPILTKLFVKGFFRTCHTGLMEGPSRYFATVHDAVGADTTTQTRLLQFRLPR